MKRLTETFVTERLLNFVPWLLSRIRKKEKFSLFQLSLLVKVVDLFTRGFSGKQFPQLLDLGHCTADASKIKPRMRRVRKIDEHLSQKFPFKKNLTRSSFL